MEKLQIALTFNVLDKNPFEEQFTQQYFLSLSHTLSLLPLTHFIRRNGSTLGVAG
jgi:hypothetical protein